MVAIYATPYEGGHFKMTLVGICIRKIFFTPRVWFLLLWKDRARNFLKTIWSGGVGDQLYLWKWKKLKSDFLAFRYPPGAVWLSTSFCLLPLPHPLVCCKSGFFEKIEFETSKTFFICSWRALAALKCQKRVFSPMRHLYTEKTAKTGIKTENTQENRICLILAGFRDLNLAIFGVPAKYRNRKKKPPPPLLSTNGGCF